MILYETILEYVHICYIHTYVCIFIEHTKLKLKVEKFELDE